MLIVWQKFAAKAMRAIARSDTGILVNVGAGQENMWL